MLKEGVTYYCWFYLVWILTRRLTDETFSQVPTGGVVVNAPNKWAFFICHTFFPECPFFSKKKVSQYSQ